MARQPYSPVQINSVRVGVPGLPGNILAVSVKAYMT
ncbi:MAG: hypothetical protein LZF62_480212 [Nitrospira sp.]|nr:MAG: hypothetical protein LZF62_480212 [Nitrospira sp.]